MRATITAAPTETRVLVQDATGDRLVARLPSLSAAAHPRALSALLESLALWCGATVPTVLFVDDQSDWQRSGLSDALGFGIETLFFTIEIVPLEPHRQRRARRLTGLGSFADERSFHRRAG
jgi:hypothetical protein